MQKNLDLGAPPSVTRSQRKRPLLVPEISALEQAGVASDSADYWLSEQLLAWIRRENGFAVLALWHDSNWCWLYDYRCSYRKVPPGLAEDAYYGSCENKHFFPMEGDPEKAPQSPP